MKTESLFSIDQNGVGANPQLFFNVVIIYDHRDSAIRAKAVFDGLLTRFWDDFCFQCDFWRFDVLDIPEARQQASWAMQMADLIIIASHSGEVPRLVQQWLEQCIAEKFGNPSALVQLFDEGPGLESASLQPEMREFLKPLASGLNFYVHEITPAHEPLPVFHDEPSLLSHVWSAPTRGWGINE